MASKSAAPRLPSKDALLTISTQLQLLAHRNKNQHRLTKWWAPFSMLRRHLGRLLEHLDALAALGSLTGIDWDERKASKTALSEKLKLEAVFITNVLGPKCYVSFSTVVADNQYAPIGLMLVGSLAQLSKVLKPLCPAKEEEEEDQKTPERLNIALKEDQDVGVDLGEKLSRAEVLEEAVDVLPKIMSVEQSPEKSGKRSKKRRTASVNENPATATSLQPEAKKKKKKKKGGDAFDDIFSGLV